MVQLPPYVTPPFTWEHGSIARALVAEGFQLEVVWCGIVQVWAKGRLLHFSLTLLHAPHLTASCPFLPPRQRSSPRPAPHTHAVHDPPMLPPPPPVLFWSLLHTRRVGLNHSHSPALPSATLPSPPLPRAHEYIGLLPTHDFLQGEIKGCLQGTGARAAPSTWLARKLCERQVEYVYLRALGSAVYSSHVHSTVFRHRYGFETSDRAWCLAR